MAIERVECSGNINEYHIRIEAEAEIPDFFSQHSTSCKKATRFIISDNYVNLGNDPTSSMIIQVG